MNEDQHKGIWLRTTVGQGLGRGNKPSRLLHTHCCEDVEIRPRITSPYLQRRPFCWCCQRPGRRYWKGAPPSASQAWPEHGWLSPCATAAPGGHLLLGTLQRWVNPTDLTTLNGILNMLRCRICNFLTMMTLKHIYNIINPPWDAPTDIRRCIYLNSVIQLVLFKKLPHVLLH